jgi:hypothetical protein
MQRPAAVEQLKVLGASLKMPVFNLPGKTPVEICSAAPAEAKKLGRDVIIYDTAGRLAIDEPLMQELADIKTGTSPQNIFLVIDAMIGQDAVKTARSFHERLSISGVVLTKLDGDARGGAAISVKEVTGAPILFSGIGETTDKSRSYVRRNSVAQSSHGFDVAAPSSSPRFGPAVVAVNVASASPASNAPRSRGPRPRALGSGSAFVPASPLSPPSPPLPPSPRRPRAPDDIPPRPAVQALAPRWLCGGRAPEQTAPHTARADTSAAPPAARGARAAPWA